MKYLQILVAVFSIAILAGCGTSDPVSTRNEVNDNATEVTSETTGLTVVEAPQRIKDMMAKRGEQDAAAPTLKIIEPAADATIESSTVKVKLDISGDLKGYKPHMDPETRTGNHIHVILDNQPYEAYYNLEQEFELHNVVDGEHVLRVFASRPWHESYKNIGSFLMVRFTVKNGGSDPAKPTTANDNTTMADATNSDPKATPEGKEMKPSNSGPVDAAKPLLTYSRPKGEYKGADADPIMIDFWLTNAKLVGDGGNYVVRLWVGNSNPQLLEKWEPVWLKGWTAGKHSVKLELLDKDGNVVENGSYNSTTREITVVK